MPQMKTMSVISHLTTREQQEEEDKDEEQGFGEILEYLERENEAAKKSLLKKNLSLKEERKITHIQNDSQSSEEEK